ncbi:ribosome small subunit-dependent GTPase A [Salibacterium salarium]|uniref:Small ribosomal subunit biogenesis GTPase RsgA n=1 Tax=Salibacterium salarium TaxID=284579 RepID=A0A3R9PI98_9BACI|nr:ribosome small subunit-dependent GTPase A [Salibacterium salarium]RSL31273.1 ribosome small subunit-dependent GTPase A [Salibacterium salarium]
MAEGIIIKAISGFYYVQNDMGLYQCRGRGLFRKKNIKPLVGDNVQFEAENKEEGYVNQVFERKNELVRPPIANIDQAFLVFSAQEPALSTAMLDRFLVHMEAMDIEAVIVVNKMDLTTTDFLHPYKNVYEKAGYPFHIVSSRDGTGVENLLPYLTDKLSMVAGESGVGKSTLLNQLIPSLDLETAEVSERLKRGKHTTRHLELMPCNSGYIADTPGFSSLDFEKIDEEDLDICFPELKEIMPDCKFRGCTHRKEPGCAVKQAVDEGEIAEYRYEHYKQFFEELVQQRRY